MKILNSKLRNFNKKLDNLLLRRKTKVQTSSVSVIKIINDVKKNGDKALLKYEKKFNQNILVDKILFGGPKVYRVPSNTILSTRFFTHDFFEISGFLSGANAAKVPGVDRTMSWLLGTLGACAAPLRVTLRFLSFKNL